MHAVHRMQDLTGALLVVDRNKFVSAVENRREETRLVELQLDSR
jgi:hypothetical protein